MNINYFFIFFFKKIERKTLFLPQEIIMSGLSTKFKLFKKIHEKIGKSPGCNFDQGKIIFVLIELIFSLISWARPTTWLTMPSDPSVITKIFFFDKFNDLNKFYR